MMKRKKERAKKDELRFERRGEGEGRLEESKESAKIEEMI
jgi:hypothetical protein